MIPAETAVPGEVKGGAPSVAGAADGAARPGGGCAVPGDASEPTLPLDPKAALVDRAYADYLSLPEGQRPDVESYCDRFPTCRSALWKVMRFERFLGDNPAYMGEPLPDPATVRWPVVGERRGDLVIRRLLGRGSFSRVFLAAEQSTGGRLVAVKFSCTGGAEARTLGCLAHPNVVPVLSARREADTKLAVVCMPYLGSATLEDVSDRARAGAARPRHAAAILDVIRACARPEDPPAGPVSPRLRRGSFADGVVHLAARLAEALAFLHARGVCHRDLKPSNVLLDPSGTPLLLDFNLSANEREVVLLNGGTPRYMAPEQLRSFLKDGPDELDERADLFSLGVIVYELLVGEHPLGAFPAGLGAKQLARWLLERWRESVPSIGRAGAGLEAPVAAVLDRCLAADPSGRPGAAELAAGLKRQFAPARRLRRWAAERPRKVLAALGVLLLTAVAAGYAWSVAPPYSEREYRRGEAAYRLGDYDAAEQHFDRAVQAAPADPRFRPARGRARLKQSKYRPDDPDKLDQAWADLSAAMNGSMDARLLAVKAYIAGRQRQPEKAIQIYTKLEGTGYRPLMVLNNRAFSYLQMGRFREADGDLQEAARLDPDCQAVLYNQARLALCQRSNDPRTRIPVQALENMKRAIELGPLTSGLYEDAAMLFALAAEDAPPPNREQRFECSLSYLREAIEAGEPLSILKRRIFRNALAARPGFLDPNWKPPQRTLPPMELRLIDPVD